MKNFTKITAITLAAAVALTLSACGDPMQKFEDAPKSSTAANKEPADVILMPDGFSNVAHKCDGPNMVYTIYHGTAASGALAVVPNDPRCTP